MTKKFFLGGLLLSFFFKYKHLCWMMLVYCIWWDIVIISAARVDVSRCLSLAPGTQQHIKLSVLCIYVGAPAGFFLLFGSYSDVLSLFLSLCCIHTHWLMQSASGFNGKSTLYYSDGPFQLLFNSLVTEILVTDQRKVLLLIIKYGMSFLIATIILHMYNKTIK